MDNIHKTQKKQCTNCEELSWKKKELLRDHRLLTKSLRNLDYQEVELQNRLLSVLTEVSQIPESSCFPNDPMETLKCNSPLDYLMKKKNSFSLSSVISSQENSVSFLLQTGLVIPDGSCICGKTAVLTECKETKTYKFSCQCGNSFPLLENTMWGEFKLPPQKILLCAILWLIGFKDLQIRTIIGCTKGELYAIIGHMRKVIAEDFVNTLPKFRGTVEIDESAFRSSMSRITPKSSEKWVFGLYERERKLVYMEVVKNRNANTLIPIIQKVCEPGTTIISDQWAAYNKLEGFGFPHFTVDHSRFFVNPHSREIHTQNIEISWGWSKYEIKRQNRLLTNLQESIYVYCWKRRFKDCYSKNTEIAETLKAFCEVFKKYQTKKNEPEVQEIL